LIFRYFSSAHFDGGILPMTNHFGYPPFKFVVIVVRVFADSPQGVQHQFINRVGAYAVHGTIRGTPDVGGAVVGVNRRPRSGFPAIII
jgi:hypothetical protein